MHEPRETYFRQFQVLYRVFLLRVVDLDLLSADADTTKLLGQFAALFSGISFLFTAPLITLGAQLPAQALWSMEHLLIAMTMLLVGLFSVLSWESVFPDRLDVLILGPLPIRAEMISLAKLAATIAALGLSTLALNCFTGLIWPLLFAPVGSGLGGAARSFAAYWTTVAATGLFTFCAIVTVQGLSSQLLPRRLYLRTSALIQTVAFAGLLGTFLLEPTLEAPELLRTAADLPSYWFFGLFQYLNGAHGEIYVGFARRAWFAILVALIGAFVSVVLGYLRSLRRIIEEPEIIPRTRSIWLRWWPQDSVQSAVILFTFASFFRSRKHRVLAAFFWGLGSAVAIVLIRGSLVQPDGPSLGRSTVNEPFLAAGLLMMTLSVLGTRGLFSLPITLKANWLFQMTEFSQPGEYMRATRGALYALSLLPVWLIFSSTSLILWPVWTTLFYIASFGLAGAALVHSSLWKFNKIPFACSYLPGKSNLHLTFWLGAIFIFPLIRELSGVAETSFRSVVGSSLLFGFVVMAYAGVRWRSRLLTDKAFQVDFDEVAPVEMLSLGLR